jgi:signal transduction histidine kinase
LRICFNKGSCFDDVEKNDIEKRIMSGTITSALMGILLGVWLVAASVAIWHGLSLRRQSQKTLRQTGRLARLLETAPSIPVVVRGDGKLEAADRFSRVLGLSKSADSISDLIGDGDNGFVAADLEMLDENVRVAQRTGKSFSQAMRINGSNRRLLILGGIADAIVYPNGAALLWAFDLTENLLEWEKVKDEADAAKQAFSSLAAVIEEAPMPIWHRGEDLQLNFVNKAYLRAVGVSSSNDVIDEGIELIEDTEGQAPKAIAANAIATAKTIERTVSSTIEGNRRQVRVFDIPLHGLGVAGMAFDVQDLTDARSEFKRFSDAQRNLLDMMSAGVAQFDADKSLSFANLPFQRQFNLKDQWLADRPEFARVLDKIRDNAKLPEVRDFPAWRSERENWFLNASPSEENWLLPDGTHLRVLAQPTPGGGLLIIFEDRTEQAQLASARDTLLRVRTATFDNLFEAVGVFAADGRLRIWNRLFAEAWNLDEEYLAKHPRLDELLPVLAKYLQKPAQITVLAEILRMTTANREPRRSRLNFADGRHFQLSTVPLPDGNALFTMLDMSDSIQIEQALRDRNEALSEADSIKSKFLANMSYEFRTPLTSIAGFADLLKAGVAGELNDKAMEYVDAIITSSDRLSQQINTVLDYSQGEAGALPIAREDINMAEFLKDIADDFEEKAVSQSITLRLEIEDQIGLISGDTRRLKQAISHLVDNAIIYGKPDGTVLIFARRSADTGLELFISDDGKGMAEKDQAAAFDMLSKATKKQTGANEEPTGLGLPLARQLIEAHGGKLSLVSEIDEGTTISIWLPST